MVLIPRNLPYTVTDAQLDNLKAKFSHFGEVNKFEVVIIVQLESNEDGAIKNLNGLSLEGKQIEVNYERCFPFAPSVSHDDGDSTIPPPPPPPHHFP